jgi:hypothetical protein
MLQERNPIHNLFTWHWIKVYHGLFTLYLTSPTGNMPSADWAFSNVFWMFTSNAISMDHHRLTSAGKLRGNVLTCWLVPVVVTISITSVLDTDAIRCTKKICFLLVWNHKILYSMNYRSYSDDEKKDKVDNKQVYFVVASAFPFRNVNFWCCTIYSVRHMGWAGKLGLCPIKNYIEISPAVLELRDNKA